MFRAVTPLHRLSRSAALMGMLVSIHGCSDFAGPEICNSEQAIPLEGGSCLVFEDGGRLVAQRATIERIVKETTVAVRAIMPLDEVSVRVQAGTASVIPELGMGGRATGVDEILMTFNPDSPDLEPSLPLELFPLLAHEMHHVARMRTVGYGTDLFGAIISEGLADQFSVEIAGVDPPLWSRALTDAEFAVWSTEAEKEWANTAYNHEAWFFGTGSIPRWTGYTIGFDLTSRYLEANPTRRASNLFNEPAQSFIP